MGTLLCTSQSHFLLLIPNPHSCILCARLLHQICKVLSAWVLVQEST